MNWPCLIRTYPVATEGYKGHLRTGNQQAHRKQHSILLNKGHQRDKASPDDAFISRLHTGEVPSTASHYEADGGPSLCVSHRYGGYSKCLSAYAHNGPLNTRVTACTILYISLSESGWCLLLRLGESSAKWRSTKHRHCRGRTGREVMRFLLEEVSPQLWCLLRSSSTFSCMERPSEGFMCWPGL